MRPATPTGASSVPFPIRLPFRSAVHAVSCMSTRRRQDWVGATPTLRSRFAPTARVITPARRVTYRPFHALECRAVARSTVSVSARRRLGAAPHGSVALSSRGRLRASSRGVNHDLDGWAADGIEGAGHEITARCSTAGPTAATAAATTAIAPNARESNKRRLARASPEAVTRETQSFAEIPRQPRARRPP